MKLTDYIIVIPARYDSKRLSGKALVDISGKTLIEHVFLAASKSQANEIIIATDSEKIKQVTQNLDAKTVITRANHNSGTDRIAEVAEIENWKADQIIVNLQGDCPLMPPENIDKFQVYCSRIQMLELPHWQLRLLTKKKSMIKMWLRSILTQMERQFHFEEKLKIQLIRRLIYGDI